MRVDANVEALNSIAEDQVSAAQRIVEFAADSADAKAMVTFDVSDGMGVRMLDISESAVPDSMFLNSEAENRAGTSDIPGLVQGSGTDIAREFVGMINNEHAFSANTEAIRTIEEMTGNIVDMVA